MQEISNGDFQRINANAAAQRALTGGKKNHQMRASKASLRAFVSERRPGNKRCVGPRACTTGKKTGAQFSINAPAQARRSSGHYLGSAVPHSRHSFGSLSCNRKCLPSWAFGASGVPGGVAKAMPPRINWLKVPVFTTPPVRPKSRL